MTFHMYATVMTRPKLIHPLPSFYSLSHANRCTFVSFASSRRRCQGARRFASRGLYQTEGGIYSSVVVDFKSSCLRVVVTTLFVGKRVCISVCKQNCNSVTIEAKVAKFTDCSGTYLPKLQLLLHSCSFRSLYNCVYESVNI